ncbi:MAG: HAD family phosphatase [Pseudomonadales bacterium]|nr:HAD family phosphatase [Pseudomonadales bacterium]NRA16267.1 HAD family phosphatase [Oceanospirillaceae bacterium]
MAKLLIHIGKPLTIKSILFDHDGTLVDSEIAHFQMWVEILKGYDISLSQQQYKSHYAGIPTPANAVDMVQRFSLPVSAKALIAAKNLATQALLSRQAFPLMAGARESIAFFQSCGLQLAVVTGAGREGVDVSIRGHRLQGCFSTVVSGDDVAHSKPAADCYLLALQRLGLTAAQCIAIEDTENGVIAASSAGITCLAVPNIMSEQHDFSSAAEIFHNLEEATQWVENRIRCEDPQSE